MRILFLINVIPPDYGGGFLRVFRIANRFKNYGILYKVATFTNRNRYRSDGYNIKKNDIVFFKNRLLSGLILLPWFCICHRKRFDILYIASTQWFTVIPTMICKIRGIKIVLGVTLSMVDSPATRGSNILQRFVCSLKNSQFKFADYIFVNSPLLVNECKSCGYSDKIVKLINNPVDTSLYHPVENDEKRRLRRLEGIPENKFTILFVGSINKRKGCDLLPFIFKKLFQKRELSLTFVMCGQKGYPETPSIIDNLTSMFLENKSTFIVKEEVTDTAPYYQMADLFLFPTTNEGMPNVVLEAMACGCMILCNHISGITDYVLPSKCLIEDNRVDTYVKKIDELLTNSINVSHIKNENLKRIRRKFSVASVDDNIKKILLS